MSEGKQWFEGLRSEELEGKNVQAWLDGGLVVEGRLDGDGLLGGRILVLQGCSERGVRTVSGLAPGVLALWLVWDEREFEPVRGAACVGDYLVIDKSLYEVTDVSFQGIGRLGVRLFEDNPDDFEVDSDMFHLVLRRKDTTAAGADHE